MKISNSENHKTIKYIKIKNNKIHKKFIKNNKIHDNKGRLD